VVEVLKVARVGVTENLFEIGLDSLKIFQITSRAHAAGITVSPRSIMQTRTIRAALAQAQSATATATHTVVPIKAVARQRLKLGGSGGANGTDRK
jgi:aryl carrier-like protein